MQAIFSRRGGPLRAQRPARRPDRRDAASYLLARCELSGGCPLGPGREG
jgi:hypothetical protein